jgi:hypothetical protein
MLCAVAACLLNEPACLCSVRFCCSTAVCQIMQCYTSSHDPTQTTNISPAASDAASLPHTIQSALESRLLVNKRPDARHIATCTRLRCPTRMKCRPPLHWCLHTVLRHDTLGFVS